MHHDAMEYARMPKRAWQAVEQEMLQVMDFFQPSKVFTMPCMSCSADFVSSKTLPRRHYRVYLHQSLNCQHSSSVLLYVDDRSKDDGKRSRGIERS